MQNKKTRIIVITSIVIVIIIGIVLTFKLISIKKSKQTINENVIDNNIENQIENNVTVNDISENNNIIYNNENQTTQNNINNTRPNNKDEVDKETIQNKESNEEKAVNIAKNNWGADDKVYFAFDSIDNNGNYIVCVRDKASTNALYWYTINIETGEFTVE